MRGIILAGGYGTRLRPLTYHMPKPMVPIIDRPVMEYTIMLMRHHGIEEIAITTGYKAEYIMDYFGDGSDFGVKLTYYHESEPLGTAGAVKNAEDFLRDDFLVMSGDALTNIDITSLRRCHERHDGLLTMATTKVIDATGLGVVETGRDGEITAFREKPNHPLSATINMGIYLIDRAVLDYIPRGVEYDFSRDLFPRILEHMYAYFSNSYWSDIGTLTSYYRTNSDVVSSPDMFGISL